MLVAIFALGASVAYAGPRKRIVVLEFEGPHAEKFHDDIVKLLKKSTSVVPTDKWNGTAEELDAATVTEKNVKKVAKKLKIDGVVTGKIEKRRDEYIVRLKLRAGTSGEIVGNPVDTKADGPHLDSKAAHDVKDELVGAIDELEANHGGGGSDDDVADDSSSKTKKKKAAADDDSGDDSSTKTKKKKKKGGDDDDTASDDDSGKHGSFSKGHADKGGDKVGSDDSGDDSSPKAKKKKTASSDDDSGDDSSSKSKKKKKGGDDDTASDDSSSKSKSKKASSDDDTGDDSSSKSKSKKKKSGDDDTASDDDEGSHHKKSKKKVAEGDDNGSAEASSDDAAPVVENPLAPTERAIDAAVGLSFMARHLSFSYSSALAGPQIPPGYKNSVPVAGAYVDALVFPWDINHNRTDTLSHLGIEVVYDRVLRISSQKAYTNPTTMASATATLDTVSERYGVGAVYRYAMGKIALGGRLMYQNQSFLIGQSLPDGTSTDIPDVHYSMIELGGYAKYPLLPKIVVDLDVGVLGVLSAGNSTYYIGNAMEYGKASTYGFELAAGAEYQLTHNIFLRGQIRVEEISMKFSSNAATLANSRDGDGTSQDVFGAKDLYYGAIATAGYVY